MDTSRRGISRQQKRLKKLFCGKAPSLYQPGLITIFGFQLGLLLSQLAYWEGKQINTDGWIYKTAKELEKETGLTAANQKYAINRGKTLNILELAYRQIPRKRHYRVSWEHVAEIVVVEAPKHGLRVSKSLMELGDSNPTITEITQNTTTEISAASNSAHSILEKRYLHFPKHESDDGRRR